jgi:hypothetical protein
MLHLIERLFQNLVKRAMTRLGKLPGTLQNANVNIYVFGSQFAAPVGPLQF